MIADYFYKAAKVSVSLLALFLPGSIAVSNAAWLSGLGFLILGRVAERNVFRFRPTGLEAAWLAYLALSVLSSILSADPSRSLGKLWSEILILVLFLTSQLQAREDVSRNIRIFTGALAIAALWGCLQFALGINWISSEGTFQAPSWFLAWPEGVRELFSLWNGRAVGFYNHPLTYAEVLLVGWPLLVAVWLRGAPEKKAFAFFGSIVVLAAIAFSGSRGVWLALTATTFLWFMITREKKLLAVLGVVILVLVGAMSASPLLRKRAAGVSAGQLDDSNKVRLGLWDASIRLIRQDPLFGVGIGNVHIKPEELRWGGSRPDMDWTETHNIFFQMAVERGLLGLAAFLWLLARMGRILWSLSKSQGPPWVQGLFFGWVGLVLAGATESWTHDSEVVLVLYFLLGSACVFFERRASDREP